MSPVAVLVRVAGQDAVNASADHLQERVLVEMGIAGVIEGIGKSSRQSDALIEPADGETPG